MAPTFRGLFSITFALCYVNLSIAPLPNDPFDFEIDDEVFSPSFYEDILSTFEDVSPDPLHNQNVSPLSPDGGLCDSQNYLVDSNHNNFRQDLSRTTGGQSSQSVGYYPTDNLGHHATNQNGLPPSSVEYSSHGTSDGDPSQQYWKDHGANALMPDFYNSFQQGAPQIPGSGSSLLNLHYTNDGTYQGGPRNFPEMGYQYHRGLAGPSGTHLQQDYQITNSNSGPPGMMHYDGTNPNFVAFQGHLGQPGLESSLFKHSINENLDQTLPVQGIYNFDSQPIDSNHNMGQNNQLLEMPFKTLCDLNAQDMIPHAKFIFDKNMMTATHRQTRKKQYEQILVNKFNEIESGLVDAEKKLIKAVSKKLILVNEYPIALIQCKNYPHVLVIRPNHRTKGASPTTILRYTKPRFANLCLAIDILHEKLTPHVLEAPVDMFKHPTKWFQEIVFDPPNKDRLPLLGNVIISELHEDFQKHEFFKDFEKKKFLNLDDRKIKEILATYQNELHTLFGDDQLYASKFLVVVDADATNQPKMVGEFALNLLVHWYRIVGAGNVESELLAKLRNALEYERRNIGWDR